MGEMPSYVNWLDESRLPEARVIADQICAEYGDDFDPRNDAESAELWFTARNAAWLALFPSSRRRRARGGGAVTYPEALQREAAANPPPLLRTVVSAAFVAFVAGVVVGRAVEKGLE